MAKIRFNKRTVKNLISGVLVVALLIGSVVGLTAIFNKETKKIGASAFAVGSVDENGNYVESKTSIYTKDLLECQGLTIEPDFEASGTYQVYYYSADKQFMGATGIFDVDDGVYTDDSTYSLAKYCRIVITPAIPTDDAGNPKENFKIRFYEVAKYANDYTITVNKDQSFTPVNYFELDETMNGKRYTGVVGETLVANENVLYVACKKINVSEMEAIRVSYENNCTCGIFEYFLLDSDGKVITTANNNGNLNVLDIEVPEDAVEFVCNMKINRTVIINQLR